MRIFTDKDKRGLLIALRVFLRHLNGERISQQAGLPLIQKAIEAGISVDALLNRQNWERAAEIDPSITASGYISCLCEGTITVKELKDEPDWFKTENGFDIIGEATHDFYLEVSGNGGKWNIPSAFDNLVRAIKLHSLQALMSEALITKAKEKEPDMTYFNYVVTFVNDIDTLGIVDDPTEYQVNPRHAPKPETDNSHETSVDTTAANEDAPEDAPFPELDDEPLPMEGFEVTHVLDPDYEEVKRSGLKAVLGNFTPNEMIGIVETIEGGPDMPIDQVINALVRGQFDVKKESPEAKKTHREINNELINPFIQCVNLQGIDMNEEMAADYDLLHDSWDLRKPEIRKYSKLMKLICNEGKDDPDLLDCLNDIEKFYIKK